MSITINIRLSISITISELQY